MLLRSIQIQGFKSFADKTVLKFGQGITAVVGPNGSGKSNIADAVRWVLGEQSTKNLRGQSMEDVIFGGTATRRPHGFCEVTLNIDNSDRSLNFDHDEVSITRRYYRSHESEYLINQVSVRLKDINELFMDTGLGRDGYSMIGQGKIDNIISSRSGERRDIFEEAAGISKYRYRKTEAERKLEAAEENLLRLKDIMAELQGRVEPLREQSEKAEQFLSLAEVKKNLEIGLWLYTLDNSKEALRRQEDKISVAQLHYQEINRDLEDFDTKAEQNAKDFSLATGLMETRRTEIASLNEDIVRKKGEISVKEADIAHKQESVEQLLSEQKALQSDDETALKEIAFKQGVADDKQAVITSLNAQLLALEAELAGLLADSENLSRTLEELSRRQNGLSAQSADLRVTVMSAQSSIEEIKTRSGAVETILLEKVGEKDELTKQQDDNTAYIKQLDESIAAGQNKLDGYKLLEKSRQDKLDTLKQTNEALFLDLEGKRRRVQILSELERHYEGFNQSVKEVMNAASTGLLRGIKGPVSSIIRVDKPYSVAIETALGATIQQIVCDTEENAKRAIETLKKTEKGRATFLPVSSIKAKEFKESGFESMDGYVALAPDLIECEEQYREIVRYLLGNTVVCQDLDSAVAIAKAFRYRFKTVSLDGQVVNAGGSLTGGSLIRNSGILSRAGDIKRLTAESEALERKREASLKEQALCAEELAKVQADVAAVSAQLKTDNEDRIRALEEHKRLGCLLEAAEKSVSDLEAERTSSKDKMDALTASAAQAAAAMSALEAEQAEVQKQMDEHTGGRDTLTQQRQVITEKITGVRLQVLENEKDIAALIQSAQSIKDAMANRERRSESLEGQIALLRDATDADYRAIEDLKASCQALTEEIAVKEKDIESLIEKRNEIEKNGQQLRTDEKERTLEREKISGELARLSERKEVMMREYDDVIRQLYDEYQLTRREAESMNLTVEEPTKARRQLAETKSKIKALGNVNVAAIEEYKEVYERYTFLSGQIDDVEQSRSELHKLINQLTTQMQELFTAGFAKINEHFAVTFTELFGGGSAQLLLSDPEHVLESGIDIDVKLPGKTVPSLEGLSGGEKALIALSIYFAIMRVNAPPFCFLDEVDTALDDINVERVADYMRRPDFSTQFICVTHRRGTMEAADMIYGVTMQEKGVTRLLELNVSELEKNFKQE